MNLRRESDEVYYAQGPIPTVDDEAIAFVRSRAYGNPRRVCRICTHPDPSDRLHEMLICHARGGYVRPHGHAGKGVSFAFIEGRGHLVTFAADGTPDAFLPIGPPGSGRASYRRLPEGCIYTFLIDDGHLLLRETILGPFAPSQNIWAAWAPAETDVPAATAFLAGLTARAREVAP